MGTTSRCCWTGWRWRFRCPTRALPNPAAAAISDPHRSRFGGAGRRGCTCRCSPTATFSVSTWLVFCINFVTLLCQLCYSSGRLCYSCVSTGLQVLSDSNITPLLTMLGAAEMASRRPVWGSTLVFELSAPLLPCPVCLRRRCMHLIFSSECVEFCAACLAVLKAALVSRWAHCRSMQAARAEALAAGRPRDLRRQGAPARR